MKPKTKLLFFLVLLLGILGWSLAIYQTLEKHEATYDVVTWARNAYDTGYSDANSNPPGGKRPPGQNKEFAVDAVLNAHEGVWAKLKLEDLRNPFLLLGLLLVIPFMTGPLTFFLYEQWGKFFSAIKKECAETPPAEEEDHGPK